MKKSLIFLPLLFVAGCAQMFDMRNTDEDLYYEEDTGLLEETTTSEAAASHEVTSQNQLYRSNQATISADGTVIELPAQQIYLGNAVSGYPELPQQYPPQGAIVMPKNPKPVPQQGWIAYSQPAPVQIAQPAPQPQPAVITLQNMTYPNTYAQCAAADTGCVASYEQQGYRRVQGIPQFAGYQDVLSESDYPGDGQWRNNNNIPRW